MKVGNNVKFHSTGDIELNGRLGTIIGEYGSLWIVLLDIPYVNNLAVVVDEWKLEEYDLDY